MPKPKLENALTNDFNNNLLSNERNNTAFFLNAPLENHPLVITQQDFDHSQQQRRAQAHASHEARISEMNIHRTALEFLILEEIGTSIEKLMSTPFTVPFKKISDPIRLAIEGIIDTATNALLAPTFILAAGVAGVTSGLEFVKRDTAAARSMLFLMGSFLLLSSLSAIQAILNPVYQGTALVTRSVSTASQLLQKLGHFVSVSYKNESASSKREEEVSSILLTNLNK